MLLVGYRAVYIYKIRACTLRVTMHSYVVKSICCSVNSVVSNSLWPYYGLQHTRLPCPSPSLRACSNSCPLSQWCHPTISSSVVPFSSCLQSFLASGSFPMSQFFPSCGKSIGILASASVLPMNIQDWFALGWTGWISLQSKGLLRVPNIDFIVFILKFYSLGTQFQSLFSCIQLIYILHVSCISFQVHT